MRYGSLARVVVLAALTSVLVPAAVLGTAAAGDDKADKAAAVDKARFQGTWEMTESTVNGFRARESEVRSWLLVVEGDEYNPGSGELSIEYAFRLDPLRTPKAIDLISLGGADRNRVYRGVYAIEGDTLIICRPLDPDDDRPAGLGATQGSNMARVVWKRRPVR
jgi:RNA polymerase sigma-70 factor (ECF subfamily)